MFYFALLSLSMQKIDVSLPFVFFRKPGEETVYYWKSSTMAQELSADMLFTISGKCWVTAPFSFNVNENLLVFRVSEEHILQLDDLASFFLGAAEFKGTQNYSCADTSQSDFETWVGDAVEAIQAGRFQKTALSKVRNAELSADFDWMRWLENATQTFPNALVFLVHIPGRFTWAGATPELFLAAEPGALRSVSLAGTLHPDSSSEWSEKELNEQQLVTHYIAEVFAKAGFSEVKVSGPDTLEIGRLRHLKSEFKVGLDVVNLADRLSMLVKALHPTPAVGGLPKQQGLDFLLSKETHQRHFYSGFLGPYQHVESFHWYVNLRSMLVSSNHALLYAGAGITAGSNPEQEWLETENKLRMNLDLLK